MPIHHRIVCLLFLSVLPSTTAFRSKTHKNLTTDPDAATQPATPTPSLQEHCAEHGGSKHGDSGYVIKDYCMCGKARVPIVCTAGGYIGCGPGRSNLNKFSGKELDEDPECIPDPCAARGAKLVEGKDSDGNRYWHCRCNSNTFCNVPKSSGKQPCPKELGLDNANEFLSTCDTCKCEFSATGPPQLNKKTLFRETCKTESNGELVGQTCMCGLKKCFALDGQLGCGDGRNNPDGFKEEDCEEIDGGDGLRCPTCQTNPCDAKAGTSKSQLVRAPTASDVLSERKDEWFCKCLVQGSTKNLCFDGSNQPGCPDSVVDGLRWSFGFPASCDTCTCVVTKTYEQSSWSANFLTPKGQRYIYGLQDSEEDLCHERGGELDLLESEQLSAIQCRCSETGSFCFSDGAFFGSGCTDDSRFSPLISSASCKVLSGAFLVGKWDAKKADQLARQYTFSAGSSPDQVVLTGVYKPTSQKKKNLSRLLEHVTLDCVTKSDGMLCSGTYTYKSNSFRSKTKAVQLKVSVSGLQGTQYVRAQEGSRSEFILAKTAS